jgi:hypothetical protein
MKCIFLVALAFEVPLHLIQIGPKRRTYRAKHPCARGASPSFDSRGFDPNHLSHNDFPELLLSLRIKHSCSVVTHLVSLCLAVTHPAKEASPAHPDRGKMSKKRAAACDRFWPAGL